MDIRFVIIKARGGAISDYTDHVKKFEQIGVHAFHVNVRNEKTGDQYLKLLENIRESTNMFLLASGYVKDGKSAKGADCVGIAEVAISNPNIFVKCRRLL